MNLILTTIPNFIFGNQTLAFGEPVTSLNSGTEVEAVMTMDANGDGFSRGDKHSGGPMITPGQVPGSDVGGAFPGNVMPAGGALLVETNCCTVCQNARSTTIATRTSGATPAQGRAISILILGMLWAAFCTNLGSLF
jgi:hypothetical protein